MNWTALLETIGLCLVSVIIEAISATNDGKKWFESLKQPRFALPFPIWYFIGGLYYIICGTIAYRLFQNRDSGHFSLTLFLLVLMMFSNALPNFFLFKQKSIRRFYLSGIPFSITLTALYLQLLRVDLLSSWVLFPYFVWLIYDIYYFHNLLKLNRGKE